MNNKIFEQMQEILKDENKYGTIILIDNEKDRAIGKTYNLQMLQNVYGVNIGKRYQYPESGIKLSTNEDNHRGKIKDNSVYIIDEGFTLEEIDMLKKHYRVAFAIVDINNLGNNFVKISK